MTIEQGTLEAFITSEGWTDYGVISASNLAVALNRHEGVFERWLQKGLHADMNYLEAMKADRYHPENKWPDVKSVIVLVACYTSDDGPYSEPKGRGVTIRPTIQSTTGLVARYAHGKDYHKVLKKKLIRLSDWLKSCNPQVQTYASVDSGPTVDRVLAETAGLGFFGKNSLIINPRRGSYFFIASLMTSIELPLTEKRRMPSCGDCQKCMVACPTDAIVAPGVIDARRCISYLTIENKRGIPLELRSKIGNRLFGCDICQEVCPFNQARAGKQEIRIEHLKSTSGCGPHLDLKEILSIRTDEEFLKRFAGTPLMRAKRRGLLRNACVVAGNSGDPSLIPYLQKVLESENDEMLKEHAEWGIESLKEPRTMD